MAWKTTEIYCIFLNERFDSLTEESTFFNAMLDVIERSYSILQWAGHYLLAIIINLTVALLRNNHDFNKSM